MVEHGIHFDELLNYIADLISSNTKSGISA